MNKKWIYILLFALLITSLAVTKADEPTREIVMRIGDKTATVDNKEVTLDPPPTIINNKAMLPLRFMIDNIFPKDESTTIDYNTTKKEIKLILPDIESLQKEFLALTDQNIKLKNQVEDLRKQLEDCENGVKAPISLKPPLTHDKNGIYFTLQKVVKEKNALRIDVKVVNKSERSCRFPASNARMIIGAEKYPPSDYDVAFSSPIPAGAERSGWVRFPLKTTSGIITFQFSMWPNDVNLYFTFDLKVDLDQAIPTSAPHVETEF